MRGESLRREHSGAVRWKVAAGRVPDVRSSHGDCFSLGIEFSGVGQALACTRVPLNSFTNNLKKILVLLKPDGYDLYEMFRLPLGYG